MWYLAGVVLGEAGAEIGGATDVALVWMGVTAENVGVVHVLYLSLLALLRQGYGGHHPSPFRSPVVSPMARHP